MTELYFQTEHAFMQSIEAELHRGATVIQGIVQVDSGEVNGAHVFVDGKLEKKLVLDKFEYHNVEHKLRGE